MNGHMTSNYSTANLDRQQLQLSAYKIYCNDYRDLVRSELHRILSYDNYEIYSKYVKPQRNVLKRIASLMAILYQRSPWRRTPENEKVESAVRSYCPDLNRILYEAEKMVWGIGDIFIMPYWDEVSHKVRYELIPPSDVQVEINRATVEYIEITTENQIKRYMSDGTYSVQSKDTGKWVTQKSIVSAGMQIIWLSLTPPTQRSPWSIGEIRDLIDATINVGVLEAYRNRGHYLRSQRVPYLKNPEQLEDLGKAAGEDNMLPVDQSIIVPGDISALSLADEDDKFLLSIHSEIQDATSSRGISYNNYTRNIKTTDEFSAISEELKLRWRQGKTLFQSAERDLLKVSVALIDHYTDLDLDPEEHWIIDYLEPLPSTDDPLVSLDVLQKSIEKGTDNVVSYILRNNPDIQNGKEALDIIDENIAIRSKMVERMRALNEPLDATSDPGQDPEHNGAHGPLAVSADLDPLSNKNMNKNKELDDNACKKRNTE